MDWTEGGSPHLPCDYSVPLTACLHGAEIRGNTSDSKNARLVIYNSQKQFESVCIHASRQLKSDTPASKYNKSFAVMCAFLVWYQHNITQLQKLPIRLNILISDFNIASMRLHIVISLKG